MTTFVNSALGASVLKHQTKTSFSPLIPSYADKKKQELKIIGEKSNIYPTNYDVVTQAKYDNAHSIYILVFRKKIYCSKSKQRSYVTLLLLLLLLLL